MPILAGSSFLRPKVDRLLISTASRISTSNVPTIFGWHWMTRVHAYWVFVHMYLWYTLSRTEPLKASAVLSSKLRCLLRFSWSVTPRSSYYTSTDLYTIPVHQPFLSLSPDISHSESILSLWCSPINQKQYSLAKGGYEILRQREETTHPYAQLPKKVNNYPATQRQIGDSQPFSPLALIAMYPVWMTAPTKRQQTGDKAEMERNTLGGVRRGDDNSIRVNNLIFVCW